MKVLVTGGAGFIGSHIVDMLLTRGHEVCVLDNFSSGHMLNLNNTRLQQGLNVFEQSVTHRINLLEVVDRFRPDAICHQAAQPSLRKSIDDPAHDAEINIIGTLNVIRAARSVGAHVVFSSTSAVYAGSDAPMDEAYHKFPRTPYGLAKLTAERYLELSGVSHTVLRYGNVYGPRQMQVGENQLVPHCLAHIFNGKPFVINGDGEQTRDFVYVEDIARANVIAIEQKAQGTFNIGTGKGVSVNTVCETLAWLSGYTSAFEHGPAKPGEARHVALNSSRAADVLGWQPTIPLIEGLRKTVSVWRER